MKLTLAVFVACLVGLICGGTWLLRATLQNVQQEESRRTQAVLDQLGLALAPVVRVGDREGAARLLSFAQEVLPVQGRLEVTDATGNRLAGVGTPPARGEGIYVPLSLPEHGMVGALQALVDPAGIHELARARQRPGGTAVLVALTVAWILTEILAAFVVLSPIKKLHRALLRVMRREGPVDLGLLQEETRTRGKDEVDSILENTCAIITRALKEGSTSPSE
jgi:hypothetical protein